MKAIDLPSKKFLVRTCAGHEMYLLFVDLTHYRLTLLRYMCAKGGEGLFFMYILVNAKCPHMSFDLV